jgi:hypothetical protein
MDMSFKPSLLASYGREAANPTTVAIPAGGAGFHPGIRSSLTKRVVAASPAMRQLQVPEIQEHMMGYRT